MADQNVNFDGNLAADLELSDDGMVDFIAEAPDGTILHTRRNAVQDPIKFVIGGFHAKTGELGVFHWTSKTTKSYLKRVMVNNLRLARMHGVPFETDSFFVSPVFMTNDVPDDAQTFNRGTKSFISREIPRLTVVQRIEQIQEQLKEEAIDEEKKAKLEERLEKLQSQAERTPRRTVEEGIEPEDKNKLDGLIGEVREVAATKYGFRVKKLAVAVAKEKGLPASRVSRTEHGAWIIDTSSKEEETNNEEEADKE